MLVDTRQAFTRGTAHFKLALKQVGLNNDGSLAGVMLVAGFSSRMARCSLPKPVLCLSLS